MKPLSVYLIAGEASGDSLAAGLMRALKHHCREVRFSGIGGEKMEAEGLRSFFPYHELSLMGFAEILPHMLHLTARINQTVEDIRTREPDVVVTVDSPGFNFRVVRKLRAAGMEPGGRTKFVHYVAPSVWAYKPQRAQTAARLFDRMLCLLPFEPPYFEAAGMQADFVGHPVAMLEKGDGAAFRARHGLPGDAKLLALLPGSRESEIRRLLPLFAATVTRLAPRVPGLALVVPVSARLMPMVAPFFEACPYRTVLTADASEKAGALAAADAALVKSGTVSLEVAQMGTPQIVAYRANPLSAFLVRRMVRIPFVNLINLMCEREVIPEFLQERCTPEKLSEGLEVLFTDAQARAEQLAACEGALSQLRPAGGHHPDDAAAEAVIACVSSLSRT